MSALLFILLDMNPNKKKLRYTDKGCGNISVYLQNSGFSLKVYRFASAPFNSSHQIFYPAQCTTLSVSKLEKDGTEAPLKFYYSL